jgi:polysaccharide export outer membrane protein
MKPLRRCALSVFACLLALAPAACSDPPMLPDVVAQARPGGPGGRVAFDLVKLDDAVLQTVLSRPTPPFRDRFKPYVPPPDLKIAVGDTVSVVIWEAGADGLFGNSLTELSLPAGAPARLQTGAAPPPLGGVPSLPVGATATPRTLGLLSGATAGIPGEFGPARPAKGVEGLVDVAEQSGHAGTRIPNQQVGSDGAISIPYGGRIAAAGRTPHEVARAIEARLAPRALEPQALVVVKKSLANSVAVAGEIVAGKRVALSPGGDRLLQVIAAAGGADAPVHETYVRLSRGGVTATIPLAVLVAEPKEDIYAEPGDVLTLERHPRTFSVFGAAGKNSTLTFTGERMSLAEALAKAGGLVDTRADPKAVFLFRYEPVALVRALGEPDPADSPSGLSPVAYRLDLHQAKSYLIARRFPVHDKDVIFVADAESRPLNRFFTALFGLNGAVQTGAVVCTYVAC